MLILNNVTKYGINNNQIYNATIHFSKHKIYGIIAHTNDTSSTLLNLISNRISPNIGTISYGEHTLNKFSNLNDYLYLMSHRDYFKQADTIKRSFQTVKAFNQHFDEAFALQCLSEFKLDLSMRLKSLSKGNYTKFKLCIALAMNVPYVAYDDPILGLDQQSRQVFYNLILQSFMKYEHTIILTSSIINEMSELLDEIIIIKEDHKLMIIDKDALMNTSYRLVGSRDELRRYVSKDEIIQVKQRKEDIQALVMSNKDLTQTKLHVSKVSLQEISQAIIKGGYSHEQISETIRP